MHFSVLHTFYMSSLPQALRSNHSNTVKWWVHYEGPHQVILSLQEVQIRAIYKIYNSIQLCKKNCILNGGKFVQNVTFAEKILHKQIQWNQILTTIFSGLDSLLPENSAWNVQVSPTILPAKYSTYTTYLERSDACSELVSVPSLIWNQHMQYLCFFEATWHY